MCPLVKVYPLFKVMTIIYKYSCFAYSYDINKHIRMNITQGTKTPNTGRALKNV